MIDITERLHRGFHSSGRTLLLDAKTEIELLRIENARLKSTNEKLTVALRGPGLTLAEAENEHFGLSEQDV